MKNTVLTRFCTAFVFCSVSLFAAQASPPNIFRGARVEVSTQEASHPGSLAVDGKISRNSMWMPAQSSRPPHILEVWLGKYYDVDSVVIHTGIPQAEKSESEKMQAAGYWGMKNFKLQYWDDANWTDLSETELTENRLDRVSFGFRPAITTFAFRIVSVDGEAIRILEFEGYGNVNNTLPAPEKQTASAGNVSKSHNGTINARVTSEQAGTSMKYVGYNQGYFVPGSNVSAWFEYSGVNSIRLWASIKEFIKPGFVHNAPADTLEDFESHKRAFRKDPLGSGIVEWDKLREVASKVVVSTNSMSLEYALQECKKLGIEPLLQMNSTDFDGTWDNSWKQWLRYYALVYYAASRGNVGMFAMQNEPNHAHSGPMKLDSYIVAMRIVSDAVHCAVEDVNRIEEKNIKARFVAPVTAGSNANWWSAIAAAERIDYRGEKMDRDLFEIFSTHSYNRPAAGYATTVRDIDKILRENHPTKASKPIVFTEIGRWMNAYLIDKQETMDSPSLFSEWAGIYTNNMLNGGYGMWAFKFANTVSPAYKRGIKSGHHHIWKEYRFVEDAFPNLALGKSASASGSLAGFGAANVTDGDKSDVSAWKQECEGEKWVEVDLGAETTLGAAVVYTGSSSGEFTAPDRIKQSRLEAFSDGKWQVIKGSVEENNKYAQSVYIFENPVTASRVKYIISDKGEVAVREIKLMGPEAMIKEPSFDIGGAQRTAEVVRLFAKGFKEERPLLAVETNELDDDLDICVSRDPQSGNHYVWIVQRNLSDYKIKLDLSAIGFREGDLAVYETVGHNTYGEATVIAAGSEGLLEVTVEGQSVGLVTITPQNSGNVTAIPAAGTVSVRGSEPWHNFAGKPAQVTLNSGEFSDNSVTYIAFDASSVDLAAAERIVLSLCGATGDDKGVYRMHSYLVTEGLDSGTNEARKKARKTKGGFDTKKVTWNNAPNLSPNESKATGVAQSAWIAGQLVFGPSKATHSLDVTDVVSKHAGEQIVFMLIREVREPGDDYDKGRIVTIEHSGKDSPRLLIW